MENHVLKSPARISFDRLRSFLSFRKLSETFVDCRLEIDCREVKFVDPTGLCLLKHLFYELEDRGVKITLTGLSLQTESYLRRLDLFSGVSAQPRPDRSSTNERKDHVGNLIEIITLRENEAISPVAAKIASTIVHGMDLDSTEDPDGMKVSTLERVESILEYVFSEILLNSLDHGRKRGYENSHVNIAAQYFKKSDTLDVAIVDNGCGLLETLQGHQKMYGEKSDYKAICIAREARVSCNRDAELGLDTRNQGIGLTVSTNIAHAARGSCSLFSGTSRATFTHDGKIFEGSHDYWRGTGAVFRFERVGLTEIDKGAIIAALPGFRSVDSLVFV